MIILLSEELEAREASGWGQGQRANEIIYNFISKSWSPRGNQQVP